MGEPFYRTGVLSNVVDFNSQIKNSLGTLNRNEFRFAHLNINGLASRNRLNELKFHLRNCNFSAIAISESHLKAHILDASINFSGYKIIRHDMPSNKSHGGICLFVHDSY